MAERGRSLADRFRRAVEGDAERRAREAEAERTRRERASAARSALFRDLVAFAANAGVIASRSLEAGVALSFGGRELRFVAVGDGDAVEVGWADMDPEESHRLYLEERLGGAWVWARKRRMRPREEQELFWDAGLEELLVVGLGLPRPGE